MTAKSAPSSNGNSDRPDLIYEDRFWEQYVGQKLFSDPIIAIVELVANCWDAGAKKDEITWPEESGSSLLIADGENGSVPQFHIS